jgi:hypothetical protein
MGGQLGPETLRALAARLPAPVPPGDMEALLAHIEAWKSEELARTRLEEQLASAQKQVEVLEQDRKWWEANAIKRSKRAAARRSEHPSRR